MFFDDCAKAARFGRREKGRRSTTEMKLGNPALGIEFADEQRDFLFEIINVFAADFLVGSDDGCAAAIPAKRLAKRQVKIEREVAFTCGVLANLRAKQIEIDIFSELRGGRIRGVTRAGNIVFANEIEIDVECAHFEIGIWEQRTSNIER